MPDLLMLLVQLTQKFMEKQLIYTTKVQATVLEVKVVEGLGTAVDVVLVNGVLHVGDQIILSGMQGDRSSRHKHPRIVNSTSHEGGARHISTSQSIEGSSNLFHLHFLNQIWLDVSFYH